MKQMTRMKLSTKKAGFVVKTSVKAGHGRISSI
jgi:hypothetical protein